ncbi:MAG: efflux RND transporter periplasmic adaptor subunit [Opitutae bacterium]|nr:efflux RND transporter periplasmic adaptor subunit [Opitutae bacterium]
MKSARLLSLFAAALLAGCGRPTAEQAAAPALPPARVQLARVAAEAVPALTEVTGTVRPAQRAALAAKVMGTISELPVALGQRVRAGDLLVKISAAEITARVTQAQSQLNLAGRDLARERDLLAKGASTAEMVRGLEDRFALTEAMVREAETMLGYTELRAPFDGVVARKHVHAGDLAAPGQPLLELEGTGDFQVEADIPDSLAAALAPGAEMQVDVAGTTFAARLVELSSSADANARTVTAKLAVPAGAPARSGQFARVFVPGAPVNTLFVPAGAVTASGQMERVFVAGEGNRAVLRLVKTGATRNERVEILSGLAAGETVVVNPPAGLREGQPLEARP